MSRETLPHLNTTTLIGFTGHRGHAWHYRAEEQRRRGQPPPRPDPDRGPSAPAVHLDHGVRRVVVELLALGLAEALPWPALTLPDPGHAWYPGSF